MCKCTLMAHFSVSPLTLKLSDFKTLSATPLSSQSQLNVDMPPLCPFSFSLRFSMQTQTLTATYLPALRFTISTQTPPAGLCCSLP